MRRFLERMGHALIRLLFDLKITGLHHIPTSGPTILMINHINFTDVGILTLLLPRRPLGLAKEELIRHPVLGPFVRPFGTIPVKRGEVDRAALRHAVKVLEQGDHPLLIAPEGHRSGHGRLLRAHNGMAYIALRANAIVVPVAVFGQERFWRNVFTFRKTHVEIVVGQPFRFTPHDARMDRALLDALTTEAMYQLAALLPSQYRGVYSQLSQATTKHLEWIQENR